MPTRVGYIAAIVTLLGGVCSGLLFGWRLLSPIRFPPEAFIIRTPVRIFDPPFLFRYDSALGSCGAPVGLAAVLEVVNNRSTATRVYSYRLEAAVDGKRQIIPNLTAQTGFEFYWVGPSGLDSSTQLQLDTLSFDIRARSTSIEPGASIRGWTFFEWPGSMRGPTRHWDQMRLVVENSQGDKCYQTVESEEWPVGESQLSGGFLNLSGPDEDLRYLTIHSHCDLVDSLRSR